MAPRSSPHRALPSLPHEISATERFHAAVKKLQDIHGAPPGSNLSLVPETANTKKRVSYFEDALTPSNFSTPLEILARARSNLRLATSATVANFNVTSSLASTTSSLSAFGFSNSASASPPLAVADRRSVSLSTTDLSNISLDDFPHHDNKQEGTTSTSHKNNTFMQSSSKFNMPINRDSMFRPKPAPINSDLPMPKDTGPKTTPVSKTMPVEKPSFPKSSTFSNLRGARNVSLPDALTTFSKQFFSTKQPYTQRGYLKEIDLNLNNNGTSAPFLKQDASVPGRKGHFVENFDDDAVVDTSITGPLGGVTMSECRGLKEPMTMNGKAYTAHVNAKRIFDSSDKKAGSEQVQAGNTETDAAMRPSNPAFGVSTSPVAKRTIDRPDDAVTGPPPGTISTSPSERPSDVSLRSSVTLTGPTPRASEATLRPSSANTSNNTTIRPPTASTGPALRPSNSEIHPFIITTRPSDGTTHPHSPETLYPSTTTDSGQVKLSEGISVVDDSDNLKVRKNSHAAVGEDKENGKAGKGAGLRRVIRKVSGGLVFGNRKASGTENRPPVPPKDTGPRAKGIGSRREHERALW